ncbi:MAG: potassium transporter TrkG [Saprospiraceae bacterium]
MINIKFVLNVVGVILMLVGGLMLIPTIYSAINGFKDAGTIGLASLITIISGFLLWAIFRKAKKNIGKREGYLIVTLAWVSISIFCALPYYICGMIPTLSSAVFESVSGLTTTGASVINDIESMPRGILLWRSMTQWIGGMGIIVLTVAIFPLLGIGGVELFVAEAPGPTTSKIHPRIKETSKRLWGIYVMLTTILAIILYFEGMTLYDACNHALTTVATGGFSTKNASIAHFNNPVIQYTIAAFMLVAGINYTLIYYSLKGKFTRVWKSDEFKGYLKLLTLAITAMTIGIMINTDNSLEESFRAGLFQVISLVTTTGFVTADYTSWHPTLTLLCFALLFTGACAGSTAGGIKIIRHTVFTKNAFLEFKRLLHPNSLIRLRIDDHLVAPRVLTHVLVFLLLYLMVFAVGTMVMSFILADFQDPLLTAAGAVATTLGNVGPAIGQLGPLDNFAQVPESGKWVLSMIMIMGRLELFSFLILFTPYFYRTH